MEAYLVRQGDVLLVPVQSVPNAAKDVTPKGDVILKLGEATGHAHRIPVNKPGKVRIWDAGAERFLQVLEVVSLKHEEHAEIKIAPGIYHIPNQVEWTDENEPRIVSD